MANLLLLYDTKEKDLARDFKDLLEEFNIGPIIMIPLSPNQGLTLQKKQEHYFKSADGALFIITPGSERLGSLYPSSSVSHEMGQATQKFQKRPECLIYLVDADCNLPAIDQKTYIPFNREDIRSIIAALTQLMKDLKTAGLFRTAPIPAQVKPQPKKFSVEGFSSSLNPQIREVLFDISNKPDGIIRDTDLTNLLGQKYRLSVQDINLLKRDLESSGTTIRTIEGALWELSGLGWQVVKLEIEKKKKLGQETLNAVVEAFARYRRKKNNDDIGVKT